MNKQTKLLLIVAAVIVLVIGAVQYLGSSINKVNLSNVSVRSIFPPEVSSTVTVVPVAKSEAVTIDFGNGKKLTGEVSTQSAYQALVQVAEANNLKVSSKQYKYGLMVEKIGDTANSQNSFWLYTVNGKPGQIAADRFVIYPGDTVEWEYKKIIQ